MTKFKAGDKVRCIAGYSELKTGHLYTVSGVAVNDFVELCSFPAGLSWRPDRFELVEGDNTVKEFGDLTRDEKLTLIAAWIDGNDIEYRSGIDECFITVKYPLWSDSSQFRIKAPEPIAESINWSHVREDFKWMARDSDDTPFLYVSKPDKLNHEWMSNYSDDCVSALYFASYKQGNLPWDQSLICRPGFEDK